MEENDRIVRLPSNQLALLQRIKTASETFLQQNMREPRVDEHLIKRALCSENEKTSILMK